MQLPKKSHSQPLPSRSFLSSQSQMKEPKKLSDHEQEQEQEGSINVWDCGSPLYDSYELVTLSHVIDRHTMVLPSLSGSSLAFASASASASRFSVADRRRSSSSIDASSKKLKGPPVLSFLNRIMERNLWKRRISSSKPRTERSPSRI